MSKIGFGGGCHWCTEAVFQSVAGVEKVDQGFIQSTPPHDSWSEGVIVHLDDKRTDLGTLTEAHLLTHASTADHSMREKYRSAIYAFDEDQTTKLTELLAQLQSAFEDRLITKVLPFKAFKPSEPQFQNYYAKGPDRPFCQRYIAPKLERLKARTENPTQ